MKFRTFAAFVGPSLFMMVLFIAFPLVSVFTQSFYVTQPVYEQVEVETCTPGFPNPVCVKEVKSQPVLGENGQPLSETHFAGLESYSNVLELDRVADAIGNGSWQELMNINFWKALRFTLTFTLITLPLVLVLGLGIALAVNNAVRSIRGPVIFVSLLPFIITPVIGGLSIRWLFIGDGILTTAIEILVRDGYFHVRAGLDDRTDDDVLSCLACRALRFRDLLCGAANRQSGYA